jgi:hypothetical protein
MQTSVLVAGLVTQAGIQEIIDHVATPLVDMASTTNLFNLFGGVLSTISPGISVTLPGASAVTGVLGSALALAGSSIPSDDPSDLLDDIAEILFNRSQTVISQYVDQLTTLGQIVFKTNDFSKLPLWVLRPEASGEDYDNSVSNLFANGRFIGNYTNTTIPELSSALEANIKKSLISVTLASAGVYVGVNVRSVDDCDTVDGLVMDVSVDGVLDGSCKLSHPDFHHLICSGPIMSSLALRPLKPFSPSAVSTC